MSNRCSLRNLGQKKVIDIVDSGTSGCLGEYFISGSSFSPDDPKIYTFASFNSPLACFRTNQTLVRERKQYHKDHAGL